MTENGRVFVKKWSFLGYQNQIRVTISRSSRNHSRPYFHQKLHQSSGFLRTYLCSQLNFPAWLNLYNVTKFTKSRFWAKMTEMAGFFVKKWSFSGYQNQIRVTISRSSRNHSRPYFHQKLHHSSGFLRTY